MKKGMIALAVFAVMGVAQATEAGKVGFGTESPTILDNMGVSLKAGTAGAGVDFTFPVNDRINLRAGYSSYDYSRSVTKENITYDGTLTLGGWSVLGDWHPTGGGFRLSGGIYSPKHALTGAGQYSGTGTIDLNGTSYTASDLGSLDMSAKWNKVSPYLGIGYDGFNSTKSGMYFTADAGVIFSGSPKASLTATCASADPAVCSALTTNVAAEETKLNDALKKAKYLPVVQIGIGYRF